MLEHVFIGIFVFLHRNVHTLMHAYTFETIVIYFLFVGYFAYTLWLKYMGISTRELADKPTNMSLPLNNIFRSSNI